jgi:hypothetical protein
MVIDRRRLLGALGVGLAGSIFSPAKSMSTIAAAPSIESLTPLQRVRAALDQHAAHLPFRDIAGLVDFTAPSRLPRFHVMDLRSGSLSTFLVAHGRGSDPYNSGWVERLSNEPGSNASCAGSFLTGDTYHGKHGLSRRLHGLDPENSLAAERGIVIHGASYVDASMARDERRIGRSQGCFAVSSADITALLSRLGAGRLLFAWK